MDFLHPISINVAAQKKHSKTISDDIVKSLSIIEANKNGPVKGPPIIILLICIYKLERLFIIMTICFCETTISRFKLLLMPCGSISFFFCHCQSLLLFYCITIVVLLIGSVRFFLFLNRKFSSKQKWPILNDILSLKLNKMREKKWKKWKTFKPNHLNHKVTSKDCVVSSQFVCIFLLSYTFCRMSAISLFC